MDELIFISTSQSNHPPPSTKTSEKIQFTINSFSFLSIKDHGIPTSTPYTRDHIAHRTALPTSRLHLQNGSTPTQRPGTILSSLQDMALYPVTNALARNISGIR